MSAAENIQSAADALRIRAGRETDFPFVRSGWINSYAEDSVLYSELRRMSERASNPYGTIPSGAPRELYAKILSGFIWRWSRKPTYELAIACDPKDDDTLVGFAAFDGPEVLYVYVKQTFRHMGIARRLLGSRDLKSYAMKTKQGMRCMKPESYGLKFLPRETL